MAKEEISIFEDISIQTPQIKMQWEEKSTGKKKKKKKPVTNVI